jgi:thiol-disulfide isomerase/thioredoxin
VFLLVALVVTGALGWWLRAREGRIRTSALHADNAVPDTGAPAERLPEPVRDALSPGVTLVQVSTTFCAPCRHARAVLGQLADGTDGLTHVDLDVTERPEIATSLGVLRTPTTIAYSADGTELLRVGGVPRRDTLVDALRPHLPRSAQRPTA